MGRGQAWCRCRRFPRRAADTSRSHVTIGYVVVIVVKLWCSLLAQCVLFFFCCCCYRPVLLRIEHAVLLKCLFFFLLTFFFFCSPSQPSGCLSTPVLVHRQCTYLHLTSFGTSPLRLLCASAMRVCIQEKKETTPNTYVELIKPNRSHVSVWPFRAKDLKKGVKRHS